MPKYEFGEVYYDGTQQPSFWAFRLFGDYSGDPYPEEKTGLPESVISDLGEKGWSIVSIHEPQHAMDHYRYTMQREVHPEPELPPKMLRSMRYD